MSLRRLAATLALAASGLACASAVNYLDPAGPLYSYPREETAAAPSAGRPFRVVSFNIAYAIEIDRAIEVLRETEALRDPDVLALQEMDAPGTERIAQGARDERGLLPERRPPEARAGLRVRDPLALAARGAAQDPAAPRRPGLGPAALGRSRPWSSAGGSGSASTRCTCPRPWPSRAARARRSCGRSPRTRPRRKGRS